MKCKQPKLEEGIIIVSVSQSLDSLSGLTINTLYRDIVIFKNKDNSDEALIIIIIPSGIVINAHK